MIPRNLFRHLVLAVSLGLLALCFTLPAQTENAPFDAAQGMTKIYCASSLDGPVVYFSKIFDVNIKARTKISIQPLNFAFYNYLIEQYDYKNSGPYFGCALGETLSQAEARRSQQRSDAQRANKQVVEVNWNPGPIEEKPQGEAVAIGPKGPPPTHTFCAVGHESTMYFSAVFDTVGALNNQAVGDGFNDFLRKTYSAEGLATCTAMNTVREAEAVLKARVGGVRANNHKAVETGWRYNASLVVSKPAPKPTPKVDDDPEPAPRPAPTSAPTQSTKDFATKEGPLVLAYCQKDPMLSKIFDCYRVQRSVYNYRIEHGTSDSLASLFTQDKVNLAEAIGTGLGLWVRARATADKFDNRDSNCIEQKFNVSFYDMPYISKMNEIYAASVAACKP